jgi:hypothetical protein
VVLVEQEKGLPVAVADLSNDPEYGVIRLIFQCANELSEQLGAFTNNGLQFARNFTGHSQQQVWIKPELMRESNRGCFAWRRF